MQLERMNPWWFYKKVPEDLLGKKRLIFQELLPFVFKRMAVLLHGARRVGKSTVMFQIIQYLLDQKISPYDILYFSFDERVLNLEQVLSDYENKVLKEPLRNRKLYIFLDEIQKHPIWWDKIKLFYDLYPGIKWFLSGSNGLMIHKKVSESLAGRVYSFQMQPLSFAEYLSFHQIAWDKHDIGLQLSYLTPALNHYMETSGFPELYDEKEKTMIQRYFIETVENRIIFQDIPLLFKIEDPLLLQRLFQIISSHPGMSVVYSHLASDLQRDWRTIESYLGYLEKSYLLRQLLVYSPNLLSSQKKLKKYYPAYSAFCFAQDPLLWENKTALGHVVEGLVAQVSGSEFYLKSSSKEEVDLLVRKDKVVFPVEVKYRQTITPSIIDKTMKRMGKMSFKTGIMITENEKRSLQKEGSELHLIPLVEYLLTG